MVNMSHYVGKWKQQADDAGEDLFVRVRYHGKGREEPGVYRVVTVTHDGAVLVKVGGDGRRVDVFFDDVDEFVRTYI